ncbi:N2-(2-carboxyethyl)arginine synthase [Paraburkholderia sp. WC7.3g]|uniref:thiamine pyrophosphate-binding protein n=1 Tax=Paraburkholderia sp. WC7.3g TaxID=2991070 RepID=UPI003D212D87
MKVSEYLLRFIKNAGISRVFGVPGRENAHILFNEVDGIDFVTGRVEFNAGVAAEFSGRCMLRPQIVFCTMGPGATNMVTAAASAHLNHSPLLIVSAQLERDDRHYNITHQCVDQRAIFAPVTKLSLELENPEDLPGILQHAFSVMMTDPPGPVHLSIPADIYSTSHSRLVADEFPEVSTKLLWPRSTLGASSVRAVIERLRKAERPMCLIGHEVIRAGAERALVDFCKRWNIPMMASANAKGFLSMTDPLYIGSASPYMEGILGYATALDDVFNEVDLILNFGYQYVDDILPKMWCRGKRKEVIHISAHSADAIKENYPFDFEVTSNILDALQQLGEYAATPKQLFPADKLKTRIQAHRRRRSSYGRLNPIEVVEAVNKNIGRGKFVTDIGYYRHHAILFSEPTSTSQFFTDAGLSSFGSGLASAIGAQFVDPDNSVFLIAGDGGFHSGSCDLETVARHRLPIVMLILNNNAFGLIERYQDRGGNGANKAILRFGSVDFTALAKANGVAGARVSSFEELDTVIAGRDPSKPILIEIPLEYAEGDEFRESF